MAVDNLGIVLQRAQSRLKANPRIVIDATAEIMETDDEGDQRLSQSIESDFSCVRIAVIDAGADTTNALATDKIIDRPGPIVCEADIEALFVQSQEKGGDEVAGQKLFLDWVTAKTSGPMRWKTAARTAPYTNAVRTNTNADDLDGFVGISG